MARFRRVSHGQGENRRELTICIEQASALEGERSARILNRNGRVGRGMVMCFSKRWEEWRSAPLRQNIRWRQSSSSSAREFREQNSRRKIVHVLPLWRKAQQVRYNEPESAAPYHGWRASQRAVPRHMLQLEWRKPLSITMGTASSSACRRVFAFSSRRDMNTRSSAVAKYSVSKLLVLGFPSPTFPGIPRRMYWGWKFSLRLALLPRGEVRQRASFG